MKLELGTPEASDFLDSRIREIRFRHGDRTVLVGGPPRQAYSLVGRARITGLYRHAPVDPRTTLYKERVLSKLGPAAAVMENVKGMLSSKLKGRRIIEQVMSDLEDACGRDSYCLYALSPPGGANRHTHRLRREGRGTRHSSGAAPCLHRALSGLKCNTFGGRVTVCMEM